MYAVSLLVGNSLQGIPLKVVTVRAYLAVAAAFVTDTPHDTPDPRLARRGRKVESLEALLIFVRSLEDVSPARGGHPGLAPPWSTHGVRGVRVGAGGQQGPPLALTGQKPQG